MKKTIPPIQRKLDIIKAEDNPKGRFDVVRVRNQDDIEDLTTWLYTRDYNRINAGGANRPGKPTIGLAYQFGTNKPQNRGLILCKNDAIYIEALSLVMRVEKRKAA